MTVSVYAVINNLKGRLFLGRPLLFLLKKNGNEGTISVFYEKHGFFVRIIIHVFDRFVIHFILSVKIKTCGPGY